MYKLLAALLAALLTITMAAASAHAADRAFTITVPATGAATIAEVIAPAPAPPAYPTVASLVPILDNFPTANGLQPAWGDVTHLPSSMGTDPDGAFRMICGAGQLLYDDPVVYPGQPGKSHLHQFYGNLGVNAYTTYANQRTTGGTTCGNPTLPYGVNRSGYWMPAMLDGAGNVVKPRYVGIYYKRIPLSDPRCSLANPGAIGNCVGIPTGLRWITGYNMQGGTTDVTAFFYCNGGTGTSSDLKSNITDVIPNCPLGSGGDLVLNISGPDCWDGVHLDSADHRSHVSHSTYAGYQHCDAAHPYHMPAVSIIALYTTDANFAANKWHLSSDEMVPGVKPGTTFHADYLEGWSPTVRDGWLKNCIDAHMSCSGGELGDGTQIKGMTVPSAPSQLVPLASIPKTAIQ